MTIEEEYHSEIALSRFKSPREHIRAIIGTNNLIERKALMVRRGKVSKAPDGFYTASEAIQRLNMPRTTFHHYVKIGKIKKKVPHGHREGYYEKTYIDKMAEASELYAIQYAEEPASFSLATKDDVQGIYSLDFSLWPTTTVAPERRLSWYQVNPEIDYVVRKNDIVVGLVNIRPLRHETIEKLLKREMRIRDVKPEELLPFTPNTPLECWVGIAVRNGVNEPKKYGMRLIAGAISVFRDFAARGIIIKKLYTVSDSPDGIRIAHGLGFKDITLPNAPSKQFILDIETSDSPFVQEYKRILNQSLGHTD